MIKNSLPLIKVLSTKVGVSGSGLDFEETALGDGQNRDIERSTTQVEDQHVPLALDVFVQSISKSSCRRLVDDSDGVQTSDGSGILKIHYYYLGSRTF